MWAQPHLFQSPNTPYMRLLKVTDFCWKPEGTEGHSRRAGKNWYSNMDRIFLQDCSLYGRFCLCSIRTCSLMESDLSSPNFPNVLRGHTLSASRVATRKLLYFIMQTNSSLFILIFSSGSGPGRFAFHKQEAIQWRISSWPSKTEGVLTVLLPALNIKSSFPLYSKLNY